MKNDQKHLSGWNIHTNNRNQDVYYDRWTGRGYVLAERNFSTYKSLSSRYMLSAAQTFICHYFWHSLVVSIAAGVIILIFMEYLFRVRFLSSLPVIAGFIPAKRQNIITQIQANNDRRKSLTTIFILLMIGVLWIVNAYMEAYTGTVLCVSYGVAAFAFIYAVINVIALITKKED